MGNGVFRLIGNLPAAHVEETVTLEGEFHTAFKTDCLTHGIFIHPLLQTIHAVVTSLDTGTLANHLKGVDGAYGHIADDLGMIRAVIFVDSLGIVKEDFLVTYQAVALLHGNEVVTRAVAVAHLAEIVAGTCSLIDGVAARTHTLVGVDHVLVATTGSTFRPVPNEAVCKTRVTVFGRVHTAVFIFTLARSCTVLHREALHKFQCGIAAVTVTSACDRVPQTLAFVAHGTFPCEDMAAIGTAGIVLSVIGIERGKIISLELGVETPARLIVSVFILMTVVNLPGTCADKAHCRIGCIFPTFRPCIGIT